jgi:hypothetical protein
MRVTAIKKTLGRWQVRLIRDSGTLVPRDESRVTWVMVGLGGSTACNQNAKMSSRGASVTRNLLTSLFCSR